MAGWLGALAKCATPADVAREIWDSPEHRGREVDAFSIGPGDIAMESSLVSWDKLPAGSYELHFDAAGFKTFVKRVVLAEEGPELLIRVQLSLNTQTLGAGPSTEELLGQIAALKKAQAELQAKIEQLQAQVNRLKARR